MLDKVTAWLKVRVMVNTVPGFIQTANVADGFSDLIFLLYGHETGRQALSAIGVQAFIIRPSCYYRCFGRNS
jgi:hypothetical protein